MKFAYKDLGHQHAGAVVTVNLEGSAANVVLLDARNFRQYRAGQPFRYSGGHYRRSPVELEIPCDGHWYAILDLGGFPGRVRGAVSVRSSERSRPRPSELVEA